MISPDLTRNDKSKQGPSGGPITKDNTSVEYYNTIFTVMESPVTKGVIWAGTDDGLVHVTRDDGKTWSNVTPQRHPRVDSDQLHRSLAARRGERPTSPRRCTSGTTSAPTSTGRATTARRGRRSTTASPTSAFTRVVRERPAPARPALRGHRDRHVRLLQRRRQLAAAPAQPARRPHHRPRRPQARQGLGRRHAGALLLGARRPRRAPPAHRRDARRRRARRNSSSPKTRTASAARAAAPRSPRRRPSARTRRAASWSTTI